MVQSLTSAKSKFLSLEGLAFLFTFTFLFYCLRGVLFLGETTLDHDNVYWHLPVFHYFAEGIANGALPLWNPYSHGGEPLTHLYLQLRLLDPVDAVVVTIGTFFTEDLITLFAWDRLIKGIIGGIGVYVLLRQWSTSKAVRVSLIPIIFLSSLTLATMRQNGITDHFIFAPFVVYFLLRILYEKDYRWCNWLGMAVFTGVSMQSYFFVGTITCVTFVVVGFVWFRSADLIRLYKHPRNFYKLAIAITIVIAMSIPLVIMFIDRDEYYFMARNLPHGWEQNAPMGSPLDYDLGSKGDPTSSLLMPYNFIYATGSFSQPLDFLGLFVPSVLYPGEYRSEAIQYVGSIVFLCALFGLITGVHGLKRVWIVVGGGLALCMLGPTGGFHWFAYYIFPPLWLQRHTHQFVSLFQLSVLFFYVIGAEALIQRWRNGELFPTRRLSGPLGKRFGASNSTRLLSFLLTYVAFVVIGVFSVGWTPEIVGEISPVPFVIVILCIIIYLLRNDLGRMGIFWMLLGGSMSVAILVAGWGEPWWKDRARDLVVHCIFFLGFSLLLIFALRSVTNKQAWAVGETNFSVPDVELGVINSGEIENSAVSKTTIQRNLLLAFTIVLLIVAIILLPVMLFGNLMPTMHEFGFYASIGLFTLLVAATLAFKYLPNDIALIQYRYLDPVRIRKYAVVIFVMLLIVGSYLVARRSEVPTIFGLFSAKYTVGLLLWSELAVACLATAAYPLWIGWAIRRCGSIAGVIDCITKFVFYFGTPIALFGIYVVVFEDIDYPAYSYYPIISFYVIYLFSTIRPLVRYGVERLSQADQLHVTLFVLTLLVAVDLGLYASDSAYRYSMARPDNHWQIPQGVVKSSFQDNRKATVELDASPTGTYTYSIRYLDLLSRSPAMLDPPLSFPQRSLQGVTVENALAAKRWSSLAVLESYRRLIHSSLSPVILESIFAIDQPIIQFRTQAIPVSDFVATMKSYSVDKAVTLLRNAVFIEDGNDVDELNRLNTASTNAGSKFEYRVIDDGYNHLRMEVNVSQPGILVYVDGFDRYWQATVNGIETKVWRANGNFKAIAIDPTTDIVEFTYKPVAYIWGVLFYQAIFILGLLVVGWTLCRTDGRHKQQER